MNTRTVKIAEIGPYLVTARVFASVAFMLFGFQFLALDRGGFSVACGFGGLVVWVYVHRAGRK